MTIKNGMRAAVVIALAGSALAVAPPSLHVHLTRSDPAAGSTLPAAPRTISLWFSEPVQINVTSVRLTGPDSASVEVAAPVMGDGANLPVVAMVRGPMKPGRQQVRWRTMSRDGHAVSGTFAFALVPTTGTAERR